MEDSRTVVAERPSDEAQEPAKVTRKIVDADAHLDPPYEMWQDYLPAHLADRGPKIVPGDEHDWIEFEGSRRPFTMINNQAGRDGKNFKMKGRLADVRHGWLPEVRLGDMDEDGITAAVMFGGGPLGTAKDSELYIASFSAYNRWLSDFCRTNPKRLVGVGYLPMRDVDESIRLMREAASFGLRSCNIPAFPQSKDGISTSATVKAIKSGQGAALTGDPSSDRSYRNPEFDPFWAAAVELDMTLTIHLGGRVPRFGEKEHFLPDMVMSKLAMAEPFAIMIFGGVFQRFPKLRLVSVESGVGWFAFITEYMDRTWEKQRFWMDSPIDQLPSAFMEQNVYGSFINDRIGIMLRNEVGGRNIMWSSDYPHSETSWPNSHKVIARDFVGVPEADIDEIVCKRAARIYSVDI